MMNKQALTLSMMGVALAASWSTSHAQVHIPNAGSIYQQKKSESRQLDAPQQTLDPVDVLKSAPAKQRHLVKQFRFSGNTKLSRAELTPLVQPYVGKEVTDLQLEQIAEAISARYRAHGYGFTSTMVEPAGLSQGIVVFSIVEGKAGKVTLHNESRVRDGLLEGMLARFRQNPDNTDNLERASLLMADLPGVAGAVPQLSRGAADGTVDVTVQAERAPLLSGYASIDNYGSRTSGRTRLSGMIAVNSPFGWGDTLRLNISGNPFHSDGDSTLGGANYEMPLGASGLRAGLAYNRMQYHLGGIYAGQFDGTTNVWSAYTSYPLIRQQTSNLFARLTYSYSRYQDNQVGFENRRHSNAVSAMLYGNHQDTLFARNGANHYALTFTHGHLSYDSPLFEQLDRQGGRTAGAYSKAEASLSRVQQLSASTYLQAELQGQYAFKNLDGASRMVLGGPSAVRAFSSDFASVDSGVVFRGNLGWRLPVALPVTVYTFYDAASGALRHSPASGVRNNVNLQGAGIGMDVSYRSVNASLSVARRVGGNALGIDQQPKTWLWASLTYLY